MKITEKYSNSCYIRYKAQLFKLPFMTIHCLILLIKREEAYAYEEAYHMFTSYFPHFFQCIISNLKIR